MDDQKQEEDISLHNQPSVTKIKIQYSPLSQLMILVGFTMVGFVVGNFAAVVPFLIKGVSFLQLTSALNNPAYANTTRIAQSVSTFFIFFVPVLAFVKVVAPRTDYLHVQTKSLPHIWLLVFFSAFASFPVTDLLATLNYAIPVPKNWAVRFQQMEDNYNTQVANIMQMHSIRDLLVSIIIIALLPAVFEETFFRGGLQNALLKWWKNPFWSILVTSIIFSAIHMSFYGFLPRVFLGMLLGYVYFWTKDIKLNMLIHFINNAVSVIGMYQLAQKNQLKPEKLNEHMEWYWQISGLVVFIFILVRLYGRMKETEVEKV